MRNRWLLPILTLALLAGPLAATLCAAGACAGEPAAEAHCAMARQAPGAGVEATRGDCCTDVVEVEPATALPASQAPAVPATGITGRVVALAAHGLDPASRERAALAARGGPGERLHRLGALLL